MINIPTFEAHPSGVGVQPEYLAALDAIAIEPSLMHYSTIYSILQVMPPPPSESFRSTLTESIASVFGPGENVVSVHEVDYSGYLINDIMSVYNLPKSDKLVMHSALSILCINNDPRLRTLLGLLGLGNSACDARRRMSMSSLLMAVKEYLPLPSSFNDIDVNFAGISEINSSPETARVFIAARNFIEDRKELAYRSAFTEPSMYYFHLTHDRVMEGDTDVHGSNYYLALLEATTGIRLPRIPLWDDDEVKGVADFLEAEIGESLDVILASHNIGKSPFAIRPRLTTSRKLKRVRQNYFLFNNSIRTTPLEMASRAAGASSAYESQRRQYSRYLLNFTKYFSEDNIFQPLFNNLIQDPAVGEDLQRIFLRLKTSSELIPIDCDDVKEWIWNIENIPPVFNIEAAQILFAACGVAKPKIVGGSSSIQQDMAARCLLS